MVVVVGVVVVDVVVHVCFDLLFVATGNNDLVGHGFSKHCSGTTYVSRLWVPRLTAFLLARVRVSVCLCL